MTDLANVEIADVPVTRTRSLMLRQFLRLYLAVIIPVIVIVLLVAWSTEKLITEPAYLAQVRQSTDARFALVRDKLLAMPSSQWKARIDSAGDLYPNGLRLEEETDFLREVHPTEAEMQRFTQGDIAFALGPPGPQAASNQLRPLNEFYFQRMPGSRYVLVNKVSFTTPNALPAYLLFLLIAVLVAAPVPWIWFRPLWRDLERLGSVTEQVGAGNFSVHAEPVRSTTVRPFAAAIDQMSLRIHELISAQRRLTNSVAHELTTPITQLMFALAILENEVTSSRAEHLIAVMTKDLKALESLVAELLEYARLEHKAGFEPENIVLDRLLQESIEVAQQAPNLNKAVLLECGSAAGMTRVWCDQHQMHRAILNLLRNALCYARSRVLLSAESLNGRTRIFVDDDGPGIAMEERERLFEPFARADLSRTRATGGHGLGLAIVQQVAKLHGGSSAIEASPLGGARVSIEW